MPERDLETEPGGKDPKKAGGGGAIGDRARKPGTQKEGIRIGAIEVAVGFGATGYVRD